MKLLLTSDWHLGKRLMDRERLPEQIAALDEIADLCKENEVDVVLVAGDVFDTFLPPARAEAAFYRAAMRLSEDGRAVVIVSGNHDDAVRLAAGAPLAAEEGIYLFGGEMNGFGASRRVHAAEGDAHYVVIENEKGERVYINALPYPNEARFKEEKTDESYPEKMKRWISLGSHPTDAPQILLSHLFVAGGKTSESERDIDLGGARAVPLDVFPENAFVALGHLHRRQKIGNVYYPGSILQYSFDETNTQKSVAILKTEGGQVVIEKEIPLKAGRRLVRLEADSVEDACKILALNSQYYIELTLYLTSPLTANETETLRAAAEGLVSLITRVASQEHVVTASRQSMGREELFTEFYRTQFGELPPEDIKLAFLKLFEEDV